MRKLLATALLIAVLKLTAVADGTIMTGSGTPPPPPPPPPAQSSANMSATAPESGDTDTLTVVVWDAVLQIWVVVGSLL